MVSPKFMIPSFFVKSFSITLPTHLFKEFLVLMIWLKTSLLYSNSVSKVNSFKSKRVPAGIWFD